MKNRVETIAAACYHKYSQHFIDLERFYEIAKEDGRIEEREKCANEVEQGTLKGQWCGEIIRARSTR